jgi:hypothetical protein
VDAIGDIPLRTHKHEIYAQNRALLATSAEAAKRAGYAWRGGIEGALERRLDVRARIAYLRREDDDLIRRKREVIEAALLAIVNADLVDYAEIKDGNIVKFDWEKIRNSGSSQMLSEIAEGTIGMIPKVRLADKLNALAQLRDMYGFAAPKKIAPTNGDGSGPARIVFQWGNGDDIAEAADGEVIEAEVDPEAKAGAE